MIYKVISLWQPWATLAVMGVKGFETRGFDTKVRGTVLIHAAKKTSKELGEIIETPTFRDILWDNGMRFAKMAQSGKHYDNLPRGAIVGAVNITATYPSELLSKYMVDGFVWPEMARFFGTEEAIERAYAFGDYGPSRFGWKLEDCRQFKEPIPAKGMQGFFNLDIDAPEMEGYPMQGNGAQQLSLLKHLSS